MSSQNKRRLERIHLALTPEQAVVAWMDQAHRTESMFEWALPLANCKDDEHPGLAG